MALALTGCGDGKVQSAASKVADDVSNAVSRVESALDPDHNASSGFPDDEERSSMPDYSSSQGGGVNSGSSDLENGTESGIDSALDSGLDSEASKVTKDV